LTFRQLLAYLAPGPKGKNDGQRDADHAPDGMSRLGGGQWTMTCAAQPAAKEFQGLRDTSPDTPEIDFERLRRKYAEEREKRLRSDALGQYQALTGGFADFARDPNAPPKSARSPIVRDAEVLIVGAGFGGMLAGAHLRQAGVKDIVFLDRAFDFGGTWYWNRYPGIRCDVDATVYMPLLEETGYIPSEKYAKGAEIFEHCQRIARHFDLYAGALFGTEARDLVWDEERERWIVSTVHGDRIAARFVVACTGLLSKPKLPGIPGIETFAGRSFHTSRWDYSYTGGNADGGLTGLTGKKVGIIGTGSTGIQCVPPVAEWAEHVYVFQRTPVSVDVRGNRPVDETWAQTLQPGWQQDRVRNFTFWTSGVRQGEDLVADGWTNLLGEPSAVTGGASEAADPEELQRAEMQKMEKVRQRIDSIVKDKATAEALKPYYNYFCKRPGFSDDYLQTFNRPNVTLVDTQGRGVERITPKGAVVAGKEYELDCLIYATGFDFMTEYTQESGLHIVGRNGLSLDQHWSTGARTLYGMMTHGFPNLFLMSLVQAGVSINYVHVADEQTRFIAHVVSQCVREDIASVEPSQAAEQEWVDKIVALSGPRRAFLEACTPSYFNYEGQRKQTLELNEPYGGGVIEYLDILENWRREANMPGLDLHRVRKEPR
jgi:cyclohexanone monooxygenase